MTAETLAEAGAAPLRILHIDTSLELRGGEWQMLLLAQGLARRGHGQVIACPQGSPLEARARSMDLSVFALPARGRTRAILSLRRALRAQPRDLLHAHDGKGQTLAWLASAGTAVKRVASRRVMFMPRQQVLTRLKYGYTCHAVIAVSGFVKNLLVEAGVPAKQIECVPDGVELPPAADRPNAAKRRDARERWGLGENDFAIGVWGLAAPEKGLDIAFAAWKTVAAELPQARLVIGVGSDNRAPGAEELDGRIRRVQRPEDLADFFSGLDLFLMPSRSEGLGSAALSAMSFGVPVVATRVGGLPEIVEDGKCGWLIEPDSPQGLADAVISAASDRRRLREFGVSAGKQAERFSVERMVEGTEALYRRLASRK